MIGPNGYPVGGSTTCRCGRKFGTYRERLRHQHYDHSNPARLVCDCGQIFGGRQGLVNHQNRAHAWIRCDPAQWPAGVPLLRCECGNGYPSVVELDIHTLRVHRCAPTRAERTPVAKRTDA